MTPTPSEGFLRSGVSRAYYFAFLESREQAKARGMFKPSAKKIHHGDLIQRLKQSNDPVIRTLGHKLESFKSDREDADYELLPVFGPNHLVGAIALATAIQSDWASLPPWVR